MRALILAAALLPFRASAQTVTAPIGPAPIQVAAPGVGEAFDELSNRYFQDWSSLDAGMSFSTDLSSIRHLAENSDTPDRRAAARMLLWAATRDVGGDAPVPNPKMKARLLKISQESRWYRTQPAWSQEIEPKRAWLDSTAPVSFEPTPTALMRVEAAEPPALVAKTKLNTTKLASLGSKDIMAVWERELTVHERGIEVLNDRDSELTTYFNQDTKLGWGASGALSKALDSVSPKSGRPLVAATHLHEAAGKLDEPQKAHMMFRFIDANLHPDFKRPAEERRLTTTAVAALYDQLGWGSSELEKTIKRHLEARVAGHAAPAVPALPPAETALVVRDPQPIVPIERDKSLARKFAIGGVAGLAALLMTGIGGSPVGFVLAVTFLASLVVSAAYTFGWKAGAVETDPDVLEALKELDAEFPTHSDEHVEARFRVLLESNPPLAEIEAEEESDLREKLKRLQS